STSLSTLTFRFTLLTLRFTFALLKLRLTLVLSTLELLILPRLTLALLKSPVDLFCTRGCMSPPPRDMPPPPDRPPARTPPPPPPRHPPPPPTPRMTLPRSQPQSTDKENDQIYGCFPHTSPPLNARSGF